MVDTRKVRLDEDYDLFVEWYKDKVKQKRAEKAPTIESRIRELRDSILELEKQLQAKTAEASVARQYQRKAEDLINKLSSKDPIDGVIDWFENNVEVDYEDEKIRNIGESVDLTRAFSNCTSLTQFPPLYLGGDTTVPIDPIRDLDSYGFIKYLHEASPEELESGTITERTLSKIMSNCQ